MAYKKPTKEIIQFAEDFSNNYLSQKPDIYYSGKNGKGKYKIEYLEKDQIVKRNFSIGEISNTMIFTREKLLPYPKDFVFFMVIWLWFHIDNFKDYITTDRYAFNTISPQEDLKNQFLFQ